METAAGAQAQPNRYAPPTAAVADVPLHEGAAEEPLFFAVSPLKLVVMSLCTFGLYEVFWFYWNWKMLKSQGHDVWPVPRAIFGIFFCHSMFGEIRDRGAAMGIQPRLPSTGYAWGWVIAQLTWRAPGAYGLLFFLSILFMVPVQIHANRINTAAAPGHAPNDRFTLWNWVAVVLGGGMLVLTAIGVFLQFAGR
jgi:hypothetical protein